MKKIIFTTVLLILYAVGAFANGESSKQQTQEKQRQEYLLAQRQQREETLKTKYGENCKVTWHENEARISALECFTSFDRAVALGTEGESIARGFLNENADLIGLNTDILSGTGKHYSVPGLRPEYIITYKQEIGGIEVLYSSVRVIIIQHENRYEFRVYNKAFEGVEIDTTPEITKEDAINVVKNVVKEEIGESFNEKGIVGGEKHLIINHENAFYLVYLIGYLPEYKTYYIDAKTGSIIKEELAEIEY